jgi:DNA-binding MarR family transcriptional regulator
VKVTKAESYRLLIADVYELAGVSRRSSEQIALNHGQTVARWHLMSVLFDQPLTVASAARRLGLVRQSVQRVADDLVAAGSLERVENPDHRRSDLYSLTSAGRRALDKIVADSDADRSERLSRAGVTAAELDRARQTIRKLLAVL